MTGANAAIAGQIDRMAKGRQNNYAVWASGNDFWARVDAAQDETYENRVKGSDITTIDNLLQVGGGLGASLAAWFTLHQAYFMTDLGLLSPYWETWLDTVGIRVPYEFAEQLVESTSSGNRLSPQYVFPKGTRVDSGDPSSSGMHKFGTASGSAVAAVDGAIPTSVIGTAVLLINETTTVSETDLVLTCTLQDRTTTKDLDVTLSSSDQYAQTKLGAQAIGGAGAASGQKVIPVAATAQFAAGEWVTIVHDDGTQEKAQIDSISASTSLTMKSNLINSYVENDLVLPLFTNVVYKSGSVSADDTIGIYAMPDRIIAL